MKLHEIPFVNYYTTEEVQAFAELRSLNEAQEVRIHIPRVLNIRTGHSKVPVCILPVGRLRLMMKD